MASLLVVSHGWNGSFVLVANFIFFSSFLTSPSQGYRNTVPGTGTRYRDTGTTDTTRTAGTSDQRPASNRETSVWSSSVPD